MSEWATDRIAELEVEVARYRDAVKVETLRHCSCEKCRKRLDGILTTPSSTWLAEREAAAERRGLERAAEFVEQITTASGYRHVASAIRALKPGGGKSDIPLCLNCGARPLMPGQTLCGRCFVGAAP